MLVLPDPERPSTRGTHKSPRAIAVSAHSAKAMAKDFRVDQRVNLITNRPRDVSSSLVSVDCSFSRHRTVRTGSSQWEYAASRSVPLARTPTLACSSRVLRFAQRLAQPTKDGIRSSTAGRHRPREITGPSQIVEASIGCSWSDSCKGLSLAESWVLV